MNAKELRRAARFVQRSNESSDQRNLTKAVHVITSHILSTVRDDDDEPVTYERLEPYIAKGCHRIVGEHDITVRRYKEGLSLVLEESEYDGIPITVPANMRQFRALCDGLGIDLKEAT